MCREAAARRDRLRTGVEQIRSIRDMYAQEFRGMLAKFDTQLGQALASSQLSGPWTAFSRGREGPGGRRGGELPG
ncbi:MAG: hypothetical protein ACLUEQ_00285 [Cloacibacillus evryensis]